MAVCKNCNQEVPAGYSFCPVCGQQNIFGNAVYPEKVTMVTALKKYAQFSGRARRSEYWLWVLFTIIINFAFNFFQGFFSVISPETAMVLEALGCIVYIAFLIPGLAVFCRRLHDTGRSGWNWLWYLLPFIGWIVVFVYLCSDSQAGENQYGPNPKGF